MKKVLTIIIDGFGIRNKEYGNAVKHAKMQNFENMFNEYPHALLEASGVYAGLPEGQFGNSEVGHTLIGAGRLVKQNEVLVTDFLKEEYKNNELFQNLLEKKDKDFHLMGLCSDGNVHASINHFLSLFDILVEAGIKKIHFHLISDGRDTGVMECGKYIDMLENAINEKKCGNIASVCGRYFAMDRDENYDRTELYYNLVTKGIGTTFTEPIKLLASSYEKKITDEFIRPNIFDNDSKIKNGDVLIWMNYRADRAKQILNAIMSNSFNKFDTIDLKELEVYSFISVDKRIKTINFIEKEEIKNPLGMYLADLGFTQARIAESEKYPHVTYFFDCGFNGKLESCTKYEVSSPNVDTYDQQPEMSAINVTKKVVKAMENDTDFILVNFANPDMVGHTGDMDATIKACMAVDICLGKILEVADDNFYKVILLSDHGNADLMLDDSGDICTTHTVSKVPFIIRDKNVELLSEGSLINVAPTILNYMEIAVPKEMSDTESLLK